MPKRVAPCRTKLESWIRIHGRDVLSTDGRVLFCKVCEKEIAADRKFLVDQHVSGAKHVKLATKRGETASQSVQQLVPFLEASGKRSEFAMDLCNAFLAADIPLRKLDTLELKEFLERWTKKEVPSPVTLRLNSLKAVYDRKIDSIRQLLNGKFL